MTDFSVKFIRLGGYSFDEETIFEMVRQLSSFLQTDVDVEATLKGGHTIVSKNVKGLFEDTYIRSNPIVQLVIRAYNTEAKPLRKVWVILSDAGFGQGVSVELSADRESCTITRAEVQNLIDGRRQWYSWLYIQGAWLLLLALLWCVCMTALSGALLSAYLPGQWPVAVIGAVITGSVLGIAGVYVMRRMFPRVTFEMGASRRRGESAKFLRRTILLGLVIGGLVIGIAAAVIGGLIVERIK
jgi:hypothetical protein